MFFKTAASKFVKVYVVSKYLNSSTLNGKRLKIFP